MREGGKNHRVFTLTQVKKDQTVLGGTFPIHFNQGAVGRQAKGLSILPGPLQIY